ncbi:MAG: DUF6129 family protein [Methylococcaceae bacterium]|jgi:hypothetical protein|nr:DUF6129 family protein [Methylococcaceae bacterium]MDZ4219115.1 DUF6129 family protein [Methylobacter sp.]MDP2393880.1 DUF6129 family protein [Methylococcaceae bacterium]MDP3017952.1 DUF6129 family protein [Methylococcaceae bacterium]MDP3391253.1 DUF6129 family protein [Methylococcaceae bacterium]
MITTEQVNAIVAKIETAGLNDTTVSALRQDFQPIHFTYCMDDDLPNNKPIIELNDFNLYLIDGREHCLCLTNDYEVATGIVVAEIIPD